MVRRQGLARGSLWLAVAALLLSAAAPALASAGPGSDDDEDEALDQLAGGPTGSGSSGDDDDPSEDEESDNETDSSGPGRSGDRAAPPAREDGDDDENETDEEEAGDAHRNSGRGNDEDDDEAEDEDDADGDDDRSGRGHGSPFGGHFEVDGAAVDGRHVSFRLAGGGVEAYAIDNTTWFDAIRFDPPLGAEEIDAKGASFEAEGEDAEFSAVDTPNGHFRAEAEDGDLTLDLAAGFAATLEGGASDDGDQRARIEGPDGLVGFLFGDDGLAIAADGNVLAHDDVRFTMHAPGSQPLPIAEAIEHGHVVAEILITNHPSGPPEAVPIAHGAVNLTVEQAQGRVKIHVEGEGPGRALLFNVERDALGRVEDLVVLFDGEPIEQADDLADVLNATGDEPAEYVLVVGHDSTQVVVRVPHFSVHTVELQSVGSALPSAALSGSLLAFALAAVGALAFVAVLRGVRMRGR